MNEDTFLVPRTFFSIPEPTKDFMKGPLGMSYEISFCLENTCMSYPRFTFKLNQKKQEHGIPSESFALSLIYEMSLIIKIGFSILVFIPLALNNCPLPRLIFSFLSF